MRAAIAVALLLGACAHAPVATAVTGFRLEIQPSDAELTVDGKELGTVSAVPLSDGVLPLDPGVHQLSLQRKGYQTWRGEVALGNQVETLKVSLVKR